MLRRSFLALAILTFMPAASFAAPFTAFGPHIGFSAGPDQFIVGGQLQWGDVAPSLDFVPSVDLGFGDNATVVSLNGDFRYRLDTRTQWQPYLGGGIGLHFISVNNDGPLGTDNSDTVAGGHFLAGADVATQNSSRFFVELKLGFADSPDFKALAGWSFRAR